MKELFKNKTQMKKHVKAILNNPAYLWDLENVTLIKWIASMYIEKEITEISTQKDRYMNNQFVTNEGVFSYIKAIDFIYGKTQTDEQRFTSAVRRHLIPYMREFKLKALSESAICPHTLEALTVSNSHVDHVGEFEFSDIINKFMGAHYLEDVEYISTDNGDYLADIAVFNLFKTYHDTLASLEVVSSNWNLTRGKAQ